MGPEFDVMAITSHQPTNEVTRDAKAASQRTRAKNALKKVMDGQTKNKTVQVFGHAHTDGTIATANILQMLREV